MNLLHPHRRWQLVTPRGPAAPPEQAILQWGHLATNFHHSRVDSGDSREPSAPVGNSMDKISSVLGGKLPGKMRNVPSHVRVWIYTKTQGSRLFFYLKVVLRCRDESRYQTYLASQACLSAGTRPRIPRTGVMKVVAKRPQSLPLKTPSPVES